VARYFTSLRNRRCFKFIYIFKFAHKKYTLNSQLSRENSDLVTGGSTILASLKASVLHEIPTLPCKDSARITQQPMSGFIFGPEASSICSGHSRFVRQASAVHIVHSIMFINVIIFLKFNIFQEGNLNLFDRLALFVTTQKHTGCGTVSAA